MKQLLDSTSLGEGPAYRGRFAPSPTGPLHFGSLLAALASYADARTHGGEWLVRIEDLDPPREQPGAAALILKTLEAYGFEWDGQVWYQSTRGEAYAAVLESLRTRGLVFPCGCTRAELQLAPQGAGGEHVYPGTCRKGVPAGRRRRAWRLGVGEAQVAFEDLLQGPQRQDLAREVGDFVLRRADGWFAYHLAVVVDDAAQGINTIVRGADLLPSTARQIYLQQVLALATPRYLHIPVATAANGEKLSKQTRAAALPLDDPLPSLKAAWAFLQQETPPPWLDTREFWPWAFAHWRRAAIPRALGIRVGEAGFASPPNAAACEAPVAAGGETV
ncbi:MAG: tRNA glutamyl-Q(34) synthetase GluQRS [Betaproteobacteria bacterium]|nr:tRNA glutamyl-Q(34) synthetase GluQRS [Betaproteobacteria bacterium]